MVEVEIAQAESIEVLVQTANGALDVQVEPGEVESLRDFPTREDALEHMGPWKGD